MNKKIFSLNLLRILVTMTFFIFLFGCGSGDKNNGDEPVDVDLSELDEDLFQDIDNAKQIFYSLPSPLETAMLIKSAGAQYNEGILNSVDNASNYTTNKSMALNLGIYTCDLSFASLFEQTQASISYMGAAKKMADGLGILEAIDNNTIERLEENVNNRDVIMDIISETFMASSSHLAEEGQAALAAIVLVGGWIEGLFIATELISEGVEDNQKLVERVIDQKLSLGIVIKLLEDNSDKSDVQNLLVSINELKEIFDKITISSSKIESVVDEETNVTTLKSVTQDSLTPEIFEELASKVRTIRTSFVS